MEVNKYFVTISPRFLATQFTYISQYNHTRPMNTNAFTVVAATQHKYTFPIVPTPITRIVNSVPYTIR